MQIKRRSSEEANIFVGSMADISFLLIIFFMLTTVFSVFKGLDFQQDHTPSTDVVVEPEDSIDVRVTGNGTLRVDGKPMALSELLAYIKPKLAAKPDKPVILRTDADATYSSMMVVFDELRSAPDKAGYEITNIAIPTLADVRGWSEVSWFEES